MPKEFEALEKRVYAGEELGWKTRLRLEETALKLIEARTTVFRHHVADGYAHYEVVKMAPLTLRHIPYLDGWEAPAYVIRGLRKQDIEEQVRVDKYWKSLAKEVN
jgi:hypothetical protein